MLKGLQFNLGLQGTLKMECKAQCTQNILQSLKGYFSKDSKLSSHQYMKFGTFI